MIKNDLLIQHHSQEPVSFFGSDDNSGIDFSAVFNKIEAVGTQQAPYFSADPMHRSVTVNYCPEFCMLSSLVPQEKLLAKPLKFSTERIIQKRQQQQQQQRRH